MADSLELNVPTLLQFSNIHFRSEETFSEADINLCLIWGI